jgi:hypothetical protein
LLLRQSLARLFFSAHFLFLILCHFLHHFLGRYFGLSKAAGDGRGGVSEHDGWVVWAHMPADPLQVRTDAHLPLSSSSIASTLSSFSSFSSFL